MRRAVKRGPGYLTDVLTRIVNGHPNRDIDQLLPWTYKKQELKAVAEEQRLQIARPSSRINPRRRHSA
jgi:hypothetical protein